MQIDLSTIRFRDDEAREKMITLAGRRYDASSNTLTLVGNRCPTRKQNKDYLMYLLKVLYLESHVSHVTYYIPYLSYANQSSCRVWDDGSYFPVCANNHVESPSA